MKDKVINFIKRYNMIDRGDHVTVGFSGGPDSMALFHFLLAIAGDWGITVDACHINHMMHGEESMEQAEYASKFCKALSVKLYEFTDDVPAMAAVTGESTEQAGRRRRYERYMEVAAMTGGKIATAHTLSDNVETVLFRLARGTGGEGLSGIPPVRGIFIRPFLCLTKNDMVSYCNEHALNFVTDSSNLTEYCARNIIRLNVLPELCRINEAANSNIATLIEDMREQQEFLSREAQKCLDCSREGEGYLLNPLLKTEGVLFSQAIKLMLSENGFTPRRRRIENIKELAQLGSGSLELCKGSYLNVFGGRITFSSSETPSEGGAEGKVKVSTLLELDKSMQFFDKKITFLVVDYEFFINNKNSHKLALKNALDYDKIGGNLFLRNRMEGDRISTPNRGCTKSLKKLFNEAHVKNAMRERLAILSDDGGVLWVEGFGVDKRAAVTEATKRILAIAVTEEGENYA